MRTAALCALTAPIAALAWWFWPTTLGGWTSLVVVSGPSMEPTYDSGDVLFVRETAHAAVGEVVVFRVPEGEPGEGHLVVHRVIEVIEDPDTGEARYRFQGDNRDTPDQWSPAGDDLFGRPILHLRSSWPLVRWIRDPVIWAAAMGGAVTIALWPGLDEEDGDEEGPGDGEEPAGAGPGDVSTEPEGARAVVTLGEN